MVVRADALAALRASLIGTSFDTVTVLDVTDAGDDGFLLEVRSRRRRQTHRVVVPADGASLATDFITDDWLPEGAGPDEWAMWVRNWLTGEFDTGLLRWGARRRLGGGRVVIDPTVTVVHTHDPWALSTVPLVRLTAEACRELRRRLPPGVSSGPVAVAASEIDEEPDPHPGSHLEHAGLDPSAGRRAHQDGRLVVWLQVSEDGIAATRVLGQAVAVWEDEAAGLARVDHLEVLDGAPAGAVRDLVEGAVHACADAGARRVVTTVSGVGVHEVGFGPIDDQGRRWLDASTLA